MQNTLIEGLESRLFMSATPVFNPTVVADRLFVQADLLKFRSDILSSDAKLLIDINVLKKAIPAGDTSFVQPFMQLHTDIKAMHMTLREERLTESANALADESTIKLDLRQILLDKGTANETADHAKLLNDRIALQGALLAGLDARIATRTAAENTIQTDTDAIVAAAGAPGTPLYTAAQTFGNDRNAVLTTLTGDLQTIASARQTLSDALSAEQTMA